ncbi:MAG: BadF/BadG/BcrA/BcrD ATPase family protein [Oscillospiraceae bacterium]
MGNCFPAGIDIGSTTVKLVILDTNGQILFGQYRRHRAHTQETLAQLLREARQQLGPCSLRVGITGSGSMNLGKAMDIGFVQEVVAVASSLERVAPQTDVAIELGGEDAKIIYFRGGLEQRMNGVCAGGTGSFIDQMASLLQTDATGLNREAASYREIYPIAARCGVFAKSDIQPLINEGRNAAGPGRLHLPGRREPDHLRPGLRQAHPRLRGLLGRPAPLPAGAEEGLHPHPAPHAGKRRRSRTTPTCFAAMGAALEAGEARAAAPLDGLAAKLRSGVQMAFELEAAAAAASGVRQEYRVFQRPPQPRAGSQSRTARRYRKLLPRHRRRAPPPRSSLSSARTVSCCGPSTPAIRARPCRPPCTPCACCGEQLPPEREDLAHLLHRLRRDAAEVRLPASTTGRWRPSPTTRPPPSSIRRWTAFWTSAVRT